MKQIDRLVIKELIGPWVFGVAMFTSLLMAMTYLNRIAEYVVHGLPMILVLKITVLLLPAMLANSFAMSMLLASLLAFGRLSSDSEITALRAAGASMIRIVKPVMAFSFIVAVATFLFNNQVVPPAAKLSQQLVNEIANKADQVQGQPISFPLTDSDGKMSGQVTAQAFDLPKSTLYGVTVVAYDKKRKPTFYMFCPSLEYRRADNYWHIREGGTLHSYDGGTITRFNEAWPDVIPKTDLTPADLLTINENDMTRYSMSEILHQIEVGRKRRTLTIEKIHNLEYGYWNKIAVALAAFIFGSLGAVLGIRNQRASAASGFAMAIGIIFGYFSLVNFLNVWALSGVLPAWAASFAPIFIGVIATAIIMWRRNI